MGLEVEGFAMMRWILKSQSLGNFGLFYGRRGR